MAQEAENEEISQGYIAKYTCYACAKQTGLVFGTSGLGYANY
jgi:hypothetical protein